MRAVCCSACTHGAVACVLCAAVRAHMVLHAACAKLPGTQPRPSKGRWLAAPGLFVPSSRLTRARNFFPEALRPEPSHVAGGNAFHVAGGNAFHVAGGNAFSPSVFCDFSCHQTP